MCTPEEIYYGAGSGKTGSNAQKAFKEVLKKLYEFIDNRKENIKEELSDEE